MHLVIPRLPNWKAHELTTEIYLCHGRPSMTERLIRKARSHAHLAWLKADAWDLDRGWPAPKWRPVKRPTAMTTPPPVGGGLGRFMFKESDAAVDGGTPVRSRHYTREILQFEADRWSAILRTYDYEMPAERIIVYTSGIEFESAITEPLLAPKGPVWGRAARSKGGMPIVYVKIGLPRRTVGYDPLRTLIHELLHHVTPALEHEWVHNLAQDFREIDQAVRPTQAPNVEDGLEEVDASPEPAPQLRRKVWEPREQRWLESLDGLWLDANGFPPEGPQRSDLTGRFIKPTRFPDDAVGTRSVEPHRGPRGFSNATRSRLVAEDTNELPDQENMMPKPAKKKSAVKKSAPKKVPTKSATKTPAARDVSAKTPARERAALTDDQKRLARNQALRTWRSNNRQRVREYNRAWH